LPEIYTQQLQDYWDQKKDYIQTLANDSLSHYEYLKKNIFERDEVADALLTEVEDIAQEDE
jgi:hypothetical protein